MMFDLVIKNGRIISHLNELTGDIGITGNKIIKIGGDLTGKKIIDAKGLVVSPGFIDMHTHSDVSFIKYETNDSKLFQGVTTEMVGCCGDTYYPCVEKINPLKSYQTESMASFIEIYDRPKAIHWGSYIGHGPLRSSIVGDHDVKATENEIKRMKALLDKELSSGAFGLSLGIAYAPGMFADIHELIELAKVVKKHEKILTAHIRNENQFVFESVEELIEIGRQSGAHVHISHIKLGYGQWHQGTKLLKRIDDAVKAGVHITFEQYPYKASSTGLSAVLPNWVHDGGTEKMMDRFHHERAEVMEGIKASNSYAMGLDRVIVVTTKGFMPELDGLSIRDISQKIGRTEADTVIYLLENLNCDVPTIRFTMETSDVMTLLKRKDSAIISDGSGYPLDSEKIDGMPHPRSFGTFPRFIRLNRENRWMGLEEALHKMTSLPADLVKLENRGAIKEGYFADITIFDEKIISDTARYDASVSKPIGIEYVIVSGRVVIDKGELTDERPGEILLSS